MVDVIPPRRGEGVAPGGTATNRFSEYLERLTDSANESTQNILNITASETFETSLSGGQGHQRAEENSQIQYLIPSDARKEWLGDVKSINYTAIDHDFIEGRNSATITLSECCDVGSQIEVGNGDGSRITISGGSIELRYKGKRSKNIVLKNEGTFIHWYLFQFNNEIYWRAG